MPHPIRFPYLLPLLAIAPNVQAQIGMPFAPPGLVNASGTTDTVADDSIDAHFHGGTLLAVYRSTHLGTGDSDIFFTKSHDRGSTWTPANVAIASLQTDLADDRDPVLTSRTGASLIYASDRGQATGEHDIRWGAGIGGFLAFSDNGFVNSDAIGDIGDDRLPCVATGPSTSVCIWQRTVAGETDLCFSFQLNSGPTWSPVGFLDPNHAGDSGQDRHPSVAADSGQTFVVVWDSTENLGGTAGTDADIFFSRSTNSGQSWSTPALLNSTATSDGGSTDVFPVVVADPTDGSFLVAWTSNDSLGGTIGTDNDILWSRSTNGGATWSAAAALNPDAAIDQLGLESNDVFPELAVDERGHCVATWQRGDFPQTESDIRAARLDGTSNTWSAPELVNTNGATDVGADFLPHIAVDAAGHWCILWTSLEDLGGTIGTDFDVLATRFQIPTSSGVGTVLCAGFREDGIPRCPCGNDVVPTLSGVGCRNSTGQGAAISLGGVPSVSAPTAVAIGGGMPPNSSALYFQGTAAVNFGDGAPFGDGLRCVGGAIVRIGTITNSAAGNSTRPIPATGIAVGDTRLYQIWYRNAADFCTSATFNLSSAFAVSWLP